MGDADVKVTLPGELGSDTQAASALSASPGTIRKVTIRPPGAPALDTLYREVKCQKVS